MSRIKERAWFQSDFYRDVYRKILKWVNILMVLILLLLGVIIYQILNQPKPKYYATTTQGKIIPLQPREL